MIQTKIEAVGSSVGTILPDNIRLKNKKKWGWKIVSQTAFASIQLQAVRIQ